MDNFIPCFTDVTARFGVITSAVYGYVWYRSNGDRHQCDASRETIARELGLSAKTVFTHLQVLVDAGLLSAVLRTGQSTIYTPTHVNFTQVADETHVEITQVADETHVNFTQVADETHVEITQVDGNPCNSYTPTHVNFTHKEKVKDTTTSSVEISEPAEEEPQRPNIYAIYEQELGALTPMIADKLDDIEKTYPAGWFEEAVRVSRETATRGVSLKYVESVLSRWKVEGKNSPHKNGSNGYARKEITEAERVAALPKMRGL